MPPNQAQLLLEKSDEDIHVLTALRGDKATTDGIWGFHAQQATEKLLKSVLAYHSVRFPFTHRLLELSDLLEDNKHPLPAQFDVLMDLTPYAVEYRYSTLPSGPNDPPLDRETILQLLVTLRKWAETPSANK